MKKQLLILIIILAARFSSGQDVQFSQYYANPLHLNPAFAGTIHEHRVVLNHRIQWPSLPRAFSTYSASYDYNMLGLNSGIGVLVHTDRAGSANLTSTSATLNYAYNIHVYDKYVIKPAISFGVVDRNIDYSKLLFGDQIEFGIDGAPSQDPALNDVEGVAYADVGTGVLLYTKNFWGGVSFFHINEPNNSLINGSSRVQMKTTVHAGTRIMMGNSAFSEDKHGSIAPGFIYKRQGDNEQLDLDVSLHYSPMIFGVSYRGIPLKKSAGRLIQDAVVLVMGVEFSRFEFGYSFDINVSRLGPKTGGAHEFSLQYRFDLHAGHKHVDRRKKFLPCPAFKI